MVDEELRILHANLAVAKGGFNSDVLIALGLRTAKDAKDGVGSKANVRNQAVISDMLPLYSAVARVARNLSCSS